MHIGLGLTQQLMSHKLSQIESRAALDIKAELAGTYALPEQEIQ